MVKFVNNFFLRQSKKLNTKIKNSQYKQKTRLLALALLAAICLVLANAHRRRWINLTQILAFICIGVDRFL